jgi:DNA-binding NarL/FixJ family response regulator
MSDPIPGTTVDIDPRSARELDEPIHLIIADDDPQTRELLAQTLTDLGFQVVAEASDGTEACQQVRQFDPEVVLMDMRMPDIGGLRAAQMIKAERPRTQVLILSAYSDEFAALGPELACVATLLGKNLPLEEIADAIRTAAATYRSSAPDHL